MCLVITLSACSTVPKNTQDIDFNRVYSVNNIESGLLAKYAPILRIENSDRQFNKVGTVTARKDKNNKELIEIDTGRATLYGEQTRFTGQHGHYTNLIYRFHFSRVPFRVWPFSLTYGRNVGLFVIITLNEDEQPVLVSTVHSCGCYLAFIPTDQLIDSAPPKDWANNGQIVFGEKLPGLIKINDKNSRFIIDLRTESHRVHGVSVAPSDLSPDIEITPMRLAAIDELRSLPIGDETTSLFSQQGPRKGYVKGSHKPFEALLMSWWALDPRIGVDKDYGDPEKTGTIFYTSLKPWKRKVSNMWPFTDFLEFWGWSL
ncbi:MAG: hypothetical protein JKY90_05630 [Gammaproteobacteria bacterium]|nr:hypothetical protein [Gammaproteobacteria bacterium]